MFPRVAMAKPEQFQSSAVGLRGRMVTQGNNRVVSIY